MVRSGLLFILAGLQLFFISCSRDEDMHDPIITFIAPAVGYHVNMPDTVDVEAEISDDRIIASASVTLVDDNKIPIVAPRYYYPNSPLFHTPGFV